MNTAIVYHWWSLECDLPPHQNIRIPIIASIATLRAVNPIIPIYILDGSTIEQNWNGWDQKLNFKVIKIKFFLENYTNCCGWQNLSRLFDLRRTTIPEDNVFYCDADVFWLKDPLPLLQHPDKFCFNGSNSGLFYYNRRSDLVQKFFDLFEAYTITALNDENFRVITRQYTSMIPFFVIDEQIFIYLRKKIPDLFNLIDINEHFTLSSYNESDISNIRNIHLHSVIVKNPVEPIEWRQEWNRGATVLMIKELYEKLSSNYIKELFDDKLISYCLPKQQSLFDLIFQRRLLNSKDENGYYHLTKSLESSN